MYHTHTFFGACTVLFIGGNFKGKVLLVLGGLRADSESFKFVNSAFLHRYIFLCGNLSAFTVNDVM